MKIVPIILTVLTFTSLRLNAQAYEDKVQYDKKKQSAIAIDYNYPEEAVENAIRNRFSDLGYKPREEKGIFNADKGFLVFKNAYVTDISKDRLDYIIRVDRKSRKESDEATLYMVIYKDDQNAIDKMESYDIGRAKKFLNDLIPDIEAANLELKIRDQEETVSKSEKKLKLLQDEKISLDKQLAQNQQSQEETIKAIEVQKQDLENLKGKRRKSETGKD